MKIITCLFVFFIISSASQADPIKLKVGIIDLRPWGYIEDGKIEGLQRDVFQALSEATSIKFDYELLPLKRLQHYITAGKIDMASIFKREELMPHVELVAWVAGETYYLIGPKGLHIDSTNLSQIERIGVIIGEETVVQKSLIKKYKLKAKLDVAGTSYDTSLKKLRAGRIDALCIAGPGLRAYLSELGMSEDVMKGAFIIESQEGYLQFSTHSPHYTPDVINLLHDKFETLRNNGVLSNIDKKYQIDKFR